MSHEAVKALSSSAQYLKRCLRDGSGAESQARRGVLPGLRWVGCLGKGSDSRVPGRGGGALLKWGQPSLDGAGGGGAEKHAFLGREDEAKGFHRPTQHTGGAGQRVIEGGREGKKGRGSEHTWWAAVGRVRELPST